jgi:hypothetical protein
VIDNYFNDGFAFVRDEKNETISAPTSILKVVKSTAVLVTGPERTFMNAIFLYSQKLAEISWSWHIIKNRLANIANVFHLRSAMTER